MEYWFNFHPSINSMHLLRRLTLLLTFCLFPASSANENVDVLPKVALLPLGSVDDALIEAVVKGTEDCYHVKVVVLDSEDLPPETYYKTS